MAGIQDSTIQTLGWWKSTSHLLYIRMDPRQLASLSSSLAYQAVIFDYPSGIRG